MNVVVPVQLCLILRSLPDLESHSSVTLNFLPSAMVPSVLRKLHSVAELVGPRVASSGLKNASRSSPCRRTHTRFRPRLSHLSVCFWSALFPCTPSSFPECSPSFPWLLSPMLLSSSPLSPSPPFLLPVVEYSCAAASARPPLNSMFNAVRCARASAASRCFVIKSAGLSFPQI